MSKATNTIEGIKILIAQAEFGQHVLNKLWRYRFKYIYNNHEKTLEAIFAQAEKTLCSSCRGAGKTFGSVCSPCSGSGEKAYDPHIKTVTDVLDK